MPQTTIAEDTLTKESLSESLATPNFTLSRIKAVAPYHGRVITFPITGVADHAADLLRDADNLYAEVLDSHRVLVIARKPTTR